MRRISGPESSSTPRRQPDHDRAQPGPGRIAEVIRVAASTSNGRHEDILGEVLACGDVSGQKAPQGSKPADLRGIDPVEPGVGLGRLLIALGLA